MFATCPKCGGQTLSVDGGYICANSWCEWMSTEVRYDVTVKKVPVRAGMAFGKNGKYSSSKIKIIGYAFVEFRMSKIDGAILKQIRIGGNGLQEEAK